MFDLIIKNGMIVTPQGTILGDLAVTGEKIVQIAEEIPDQSTVTLDAEGKYLLPGLVDARTHFLKQREGFDPVVELLQGSRAALFGGVTSILEEADPQGRLRLREQLSACRELAEAHCYTDYGFHGLFQSLHPDFLDELKEQEEAGSSSLNASLSGPYALQTGDLSRIFVCSAAAGQLLCIHAEAEEPIANLQKLLQQNHLSSPYYHSISRPNLTEAQAVAQALAAAAAAGDAPVYIQQVSCRESLEQIRAARARGQQHIYVETCPHYLLLDSSCCAQGDGGARYVVEPPLRSPADKQAVWSALGSGVIQCLSSDHYSYTLAEKENPRPDVKWEFRHCPPGLPSAEHRLDLLYHHGVCQGLLSMERLAAVCSTNPARIFGLYPRKGLLAPGSDADIVIYDGEMAQHPLSIHGGSDYSPYAGQRLRGGVLSVLLRGKLLVDRGALLEESPRGCFLPRDKGFLELESLL